MSIRMNTKMHISLREKHAFLYVVSNVCGVSVFELSVLLHFTEEIVRNQQYFCLRVVTRYHLTKRLSLLCANNGS